MKKVLSVILALMLVLITVTGVSMLTMAGEDGGEYVEPAGDAGDVSAGGIDDWEGSPPSTWDDGIMDDGLEPGEDPYAGEEGGDDYGYDGYDDYGYDDGYWEPEYVPDNSAAPAPEAPTQQETTAAPETAPAQDVVPGELYENPLTGLKDLPAEAVGKRPVAVMINNHPKSYPQLNISQADVLFEVVVEHTLTRFMALFANYLKVPNLCSVRSYRYYFPAISNGFDAFYIHWGEDTTMMDYYRELNLDSYDGMSNTFLFGRDQSRLDAGYDLEHTSTFYGTMLPEQLAADGKRVDIDAEHAGPRFDFVPEGTVAVPTGSPCSFIDIQFGEQTGQLTYDPVSHTYKKFANGEPQIDGVTGEQLGFTNAIILYTWITDRDPAGSEDAEADRKWLDVFGVGAEYANGFYCSEGAAQKITWYRESASDRFHFFDENGNVLPINRGKSYIAFTYFDSATGSGTVPEGFELQ